MVNLNGTIAALWRWWWLLLTAAGMAGLIAFQGVRQAPPTFVSTTTLMVGDVLRSPKPGEDEFSIAQNLAASYALLAQRQPILEGTVRALDLPYDWEELKRRIVVIHANGALTLEIRAMDGDPVRARDIAATLASQLVDASPTRDRRQELEQRRQFVRDELNDLQQKIATGREELRRKQAQLASEQSARGVLDRQDEIKALELNLTAWRTTYNSLLASIEGRSDPNSLSILEPAAVPTRPTSPRGLWNVALAAIGALLVVAAGIVLMELFNRKIRSRDDLRELMVDEPDGLVTYVPKMDLAKGPIAVVADPTSRAADTYRLLAAQLRFGVLGPGSHILMVTSAGNREGKSTTAANLAAALAQGGSSVLLVDLDLRRPTLHTLFGVPNRGGAAAMLRYGDFNPDQYVVRTALPRLWLLPAGTAQENPTELISRSGKALLLSAWSTVDIVIIDGPPLLSAADAAVLTGFVPDTLFVTRFEHSSGRDVRAALDMLSALPTRVRGTVINGAPAQRTALYGYPYDVPGTGPANGAARGRGKLASLVPFRASRANGATNGHANGIPASATSTTALVIPASAVSTRPWLADDDHL